MTHKLTIRVYYEDTDMAGIVYYANFLKFIERARSEMLRELGVDQVAVKADQGVVFAVRRVEADYLSPALFDDELVVETSVEALSGARVVLRQNVMRGGVVLFASLVTIIALSVAGRASGRASGRAVRLPADVRRMMAGGEE